MISLTKITNSSNFGNYFLKISPFENNFEALKEVVLATAEV